MGHVTSNWRTTTFLLGLTHHDFLEAFGGSRPSQQSGIPQCPWLGAPMVQQQSTTGVSIIFQFLVPLFHSTYCSFCENTASEVKTRACWRKYTCSQKRPSLFLWNYKLSTCQERVRKLTKGEVATASYLRGKKRNIFSTINMVSA